MCGIVAGVAQRDVVQILIEGLKRLEYRGYDSAGLAVVSDTGVLSRVRACGKVSMLSAALSATPQSGRIGIAHTRWATHGKPSEENAHPQMSGNQLAVVHNGIIENHQPLKDDLIKKGYQFSSQTDTEVIAHLLTACFKETKDIHKAMSQAVASLEGAFAIVAIFESAPDTLWVARSGAPVVIGLGVGENFVASDTLALLPVTQSFVYLLENEIASVTVDGYKIFQGEQQVKRTAQIINRSPEQLGKGSYRHFMQKEIFEQPLAISDALEGRLGDERVFEACFGHDFPKLAQEIKHVQILGCGTSYHAGLIARYWLESLGVPCQVEVASEFRYRKPSILPETMLVAISQSGETADTLSALREHRAAYRATLSICNVPESALVRETDFQLLTHAGPEIGVASTKAFTTQLTALLILSVALGRARGLDAEQEREVVQALRALPEQIEKALALDETIKSLAQKIYQDNHCLFLGRHSLYPVALEGALKLKEISYIHAEAYPAGELKHGPLALIDENMPVIGISSSTMLLSKLKSNVQEILARGGRVIMFAQASEDWSDISHEQLEVVVTPETNDWTAPILSTIPLQLLAYHVAVLKGTDVDQPRNLAKSVTVE